jgi:hypothetical protein
MDFHTPRANQYGLLHLMTNMLWKYAIYSYFEAFIGLGWCYVKYSDLHLSALLATIG